MTVRPSLLFLTVMLMPAAAAAHPHVFIDAALQLDYDRDGRLNQVAVEWAYDDFYSLLIIEDMGLDPDGDGVLTAEEEASLQGFDADWAPGSQGGLYLGVEGRRIPLQAPRDFSARYQDGRLISRHVRPLDQPLDSAAPLLIQVYDPEYYVQFSLPDPPVTNGGRNCQIRQRPGDPYAAADAYAQAVAAALEDDDTGMTEEMLMVDIGGAGADEVRIQCGTAP
nr:DUF1007 family protein [Paracoccus saliphilus]